MSEKITNMIEEIKALTVLELNELVKAIEEEFGVSAAAPVAVMSREDAALLLENLPLLEELGFGCEDFGGDTVLVRRIPADVDAGDVTATLEEFAEKLRTGRSPSERREQLLHTMACKSAIKAGMHSDQRELRTLVDRVQSGEIRYCPHGRPVAAKLSRYELEKLFKRA